jgi:hypothetical protein
MKCVVKDCKNTNIVAKSLCSKHYHRQHRYNDVNFVKQNKDQFEICQIDKCKNKTVSRNLCSGHYARWKKNKENFDKSPLRKVLQYSEEDVCVIPRCQGKPHAKNMCKQHYSHQNKHDINFFSILDMFEKGCETCGSFDNLSVDHDHSICSGKRVCEKCFRGILCMKCNVALGSVKDNKKTLKKMIQYLEK